MVRRGGIDDPRRLRWPPSGTADPLTARSCPDLVVTILFPDLDSTGTHQANGVLHNKGSGSTALPRAPQQAPAIAALPHPRSSSNRYRFAPASLLNEHSLLLCSRFSAQRACGSVALPLPRSTRAYGSAALPLPRSTSIRERCAPASRVRRA